MPRAVVVSNSARSSPAVTRTRKKSAASGGASSIPRPPRASKRKAASSSTGSASEARASSTGTNSLPPQPKRARKSSTTVALNPRSAGPEVAATTSKRSRAESSTRKEKPEKRLARYIASPSSATNERITRAYQQRLYLIDKKLVGEDPTSPTGCLFNVLGSTGNVYEVKLQQRPACTCPDFPRSGLCKHILFVMLRVLKLDRLDPRVWQKALLTSELKELLETSATTDGVLASQTVRERFQEIQRSSGKLEVDSKTVQRDINGDCPICYEGMDDGHGKAKEPVVFCRICGNNVHRDCFEKWSQSKSSSGGQTTCIYCRALWSETDADNKGKFTSDYVNLGGVSASHHYASLQELYPQTNEFNDFNGRRGRGRGRGTGRG